MNLGIFVKTPGFSPIKTRLARRLGSSTVEAFHKKAADVTAAVYRESGFQVHWVVAEPEAIHEWEDLPVLVQRGDGLGEKLHYAYSELLSDSVGAAMVGADSPHVTLEFALRARKTMEAHDFVVSPAEDGGFVFFGGKREIDPGIWRTAPYSSSDTWKVLGRSIPAFELAVSFDVDEWEDFQRAAQVLLKSEFRPQKELGEWMKNGIAGV